LKKFSELFDALAAIEESNRNIQITEQLGQSRSQLRPIREHEPPDFGGNRSNMDTFTSNVLETLKPDSDFWTRLFLKEFVYRDDWAGDLEPDHPGLQVFEYVQMLPPFIESIFNRLCVLRVLFDDFPHHKGIPEELSELAKSLRHFHDKIEDGIVMERPPTIPEITYRASGGLGGVTFSSAWDTPMEVPIGAVPPLDFATSESCKSTQVSPALVVTLMIASRTRRVRVSPYSQVWSSKTTTSDSLQSML
jgi:hypothetical protein